MAYGRPLLKSLAKLNPFQSRKSATLAAGVVVGGGIAAATYYVSSAPKRVAKLATKIQEFKDATTDTLERSLIFQPLDKLYLIHSVKPLELKEHEALKNLITTSNVRINKFREESTKLGHIKDWWILNKLMDFQQLSKQLTQIDTLLAETKSLLDYADQLNSAEKFFKQRLYALAKIAVDNALKEIKEDKAITIGELSWDRLCAHTYNLAAKIARCQEDYNGSQEYYALARTHDADDPYVLCSQLALWGDLAWKDAKSAPTEKVELVKLREFLQDEKANGALVEACKQARYGLGLANLSWLYIQAAQNIDLLKLPLQDKSAFLEKACQLAQASTVFEANKAVDDRSINPWLFLGIAKMERAGQQNKELLTGALVDFEAALTMDPTHPSLLRRKAMVLAALGQDTQEADENFIMELRYRINSGDTQKLYSNWLSEALKRRPIEQESKEGKPSAETLMQVRDYLLKGHYQTAYDVFRRLPDNDTDKAKKAEIKTWFEQHFSISPEEKLTAKIRDRTLVNLEIENLPTPAVFIGLSIATYQAKHGKPLGLPSDWKELCTSLCVVPETAKTGYLAVAYQHKQTGQIIIGHGGTDVSDPRDLKADLHLALGQPHQLEAAKAFTHYVMRQYTPSVKNSHAYIIYHTGHSLGGAIAAHMACTAGQVITPDNKTWLQYAITFDNPSCWWQLDSHFNGILKSRLLKQHYPNFPITAYLTRPTFINCAGGPHLGRVIKLPVYPTKAQLPQEILQQTAITFLMGKINSSLKDYIARYTLVPPTLLQTFDQDLSNWQGRIKANIACHKAELLQAAFTTTPPRFYQESEKISYANAWPEDLAKWIAFEQHMGTLKQDPLTYVPEAKETDYQLQPFASAAKELLPLTIVETGLKDLLLKVLPDPKKTDHLSEEEKVFRSFFHQDFFDWIKLSADKKHLEIEGPLSSWELMGYLRGRIHKACQEKHISYQAFMYPPLADFAVPVIKLKKTEPKVLFGSFFRTQNDSPSNPIPVLAEEKAVKRAPPRTPGLSA